MQENSVKIGDTKVNNITAKQKHKTMIHQSLTPSHSLSLLKN